MGTAVKRQGDAAGTYQPFGWASRGCPGKRRAYLFIYFFQSLHTLERGREEPPTLYEKVTFKKSNSLEARANGNCLFGFVCVWVVRIFLIDFFFFFNNIAQYLIFCRTNNFCFLCYEILETVLNFKESKHASAEKTQQKSSLSCPL